MTQELGARLVEMARARGADQAEAYVRLSKSLAIEAKDQKVDSLEAATTIGYSVRVVREGRLGFSYSNNLRDPALVIERAIEASRYAEPDVYNLLPSKTEPSSVAVLDDTLTSLSEADAAAQVMLLERSAFAEDACVKKIRKAAGHFSSMTTAIVNSEGVSVEYRSTHCSAQIMAVAEEGNESQMGWDYEGSRFLEDVSFERVGRNAARKAAGLLGSKKTPSAKGSILLDSSVAYEFLGMLSSSLSAEAVQKNRSMLAGKKDAAVISTLVNVVDNGLIDRKTGSRPVDAEGVATTRKTLIERGALRGFLYNTYCGGKEGRASTGNAVRGSYSGLPGVGPTNLFIEPAERECVRSFDRLVAAIDRGMYVLETMGMHTANPISGDFSVGAAGLWVEKGGLTHPVKEAVISGNILQLFSNIRLVGDDLKFYGSIGTPTILIDEIDISG